MSKAKYILSETSINGVTLNEKISNDELFEYQIIDREDFLDSLIGWISEAGIKSSDKPLMKADLKLLMNVEYDYILSSINTNRYLYEGCPGFNETCENLLELNKSLE